MQPVDARQWAGGDSDSADGGLRFGVLGPLTVLAGGEVVSIGGPKERAVLAHLLARANQVVSTGALIASMWGDHPPRSAERTLQAYVSRLRGALEPGRAAGADSTLLVKLGDGYRLRVAPQQVDALLFEELARRGSQQLREGDGAARTTLREALALWRGEAWGEFVDVEMCEAEARRVDEMRVVAIEDRVDADLAGGAASELVAELESLVSRYEFRERFWAQLMLALYRAGRQSEALGAYRRARAVLVDQLGIEPGRELRTLEAAILAQDPALDLRPLDRCFGLPSALEMVGPAFVGRDAELAWLRSAWMDAVDGRGGFVSVLGPEGIGKTRLVAEIAREVQRAGGVVLYGRCGDGDGGLNRLLGDTFASAGVSADELEGTPVSQLGEAMMQMLAAASRGQPVLLAVDDVHRADTDTIEMLAELAGWSDAGALLIVATFRTDADEPDRMERRTGVAGAHLMLGGLDRDAVRRVCEIYDAEPWWTDHLDRLVEVTDGVPLRVHELASQWTRERAAREVATAADRSAAAQVRLAGLRAEIAQSVQSIQHVLEQRRANLAPRQSELRVTEGERDQTRPRRPYKGLAAFDSDDAADFFGREHLVAELVARLAGAQLLAVVGPSGSGKSSLVRAGLIPALAAGVLPVSGGWSTVIVTPGARRGRSDPLAAAAELRSAARGRRLVVVDQFEELFGLSDLEQAAFVDRVVTVARSPDCVVVVAIRADHLDRCASFPQLADLLAGNDVLVGPMRELELRRAIERPAHRAGGAFEPGLVDVVIADVAGRPGALPLLSTALAETWERRVDGVITLDAYRSVGGVDGALASIAEQTYGSLEPGQQVAARRLLTRLSDASEPAPLELRRRLPLTAIGDNDDDQRALNALVDRRLLVVDRDTVEVAHEALLREWPRLRAWMDEDARGRQLHRHLREATQAWTAGGKPAFELYRGTRLDAALEWAATHPGDVEPAEHEFLDAATHENARELNEAHRRVAEKARDNRRLRWSLIGIAGLLVVAVVAGLLFLRQRDRAERTAREAKARELASESTGAIDEDPELAMLLGLEAIDTTQRAGGDPLPETVSALQQATQGSRLELRREDAIGFLDVSDDGARIAAGSAADLGEVLVLDSASGELVNTLPEPHPDALAQDASYSPDGRLLVSYFNFEEPYSPAVVVWDSETGEQLARLPSSDERYFAHDFSADGRRLVTLSEGGNDADDLVTVWDVATGRELLEIPLDGHGGSPVFLPDGTTLAIPEHDAGRVGLFSSVDGTRLRNIPTPGIKAQGTALHGPSGLLALGSQISRQVQIIDLNTETVVHRIALTDVGPLDWSADGALLAVAGGNSSPIHVLDAATGDDALVLVGHTSGSWDTGFIGDGERLASVGSNGELRIWDVTADGPPALHAHAPASGAPWDVRLSPDGSEMLVATLGASIERIATDSGDVLAQLTGQLVGQLPYLAPASSDWRYVASVDETTGRGAVLDLTTFTPITTLPPCTGPVEFSPDSTMLVLQGTTLCGPTNGLFAPPPGATRRNRVIEIATGRPILDLGTSLIYNAAFNPQGAFAAGQYLAVNAGAVRADIYDLRARRLVARIPVDGTLFRVTFDPTGQRIIAATGDGRISVLDFVAIVSGTPPDAATLVDVAAHDGGITGHAASRDGALATAALGESVKLWDLASGEQLVELHTEPSTGLSIVAFTPDGSDLLYSDGALLRRYPLDPDRLIDLAQDLLTRDLTARRVSPIPRHRLPLPMTAEQTSEHVGRPEPSAAPRLRLRRACTVTRGPQVRRPVNGGARYRPESVRSITLGGSPGCCRQRGALPAMRRAS